VCNSNSFGCFSIYEYSSSPSPNRYEPTLLSTCPDDNVEWTHIACGAFHTVALTKKGEVYTWGQNENGELGHGDMEDRERTPTKVSSLSGVVVNHIACGRYYKAAITDKGEIFTW
jgi:alpha-tubulin suppressor-like RCC1 family protein